MPPHHYLTTPMCGLCFLKRALTGLRRDAITCVRTGEGVRHVKRDQWTPRFGDKQRCSTTSIRRSTYSFRGGEFLFSRVSCSSVTACFAAAITRARSTAIMRLREAAGTSVGSAQSSVHFDCRRRGIASGLLGKSGPQILCTVESRKTAPQRRQWFGR